MINFNKYCYQLDQLNGAPNKKGVYLFNRKCIIFYQDNAVPHVYLMTRPPPQKKKKLFQLICKVLIHQLYSPDIAPLDFHLFWSLQNSPNGKDFNSLEDCKKHLEQFFTQNKFLVIELWSYAWKMAENSGTKQWMCSVKFLVKMKNVSFIFT